MSKQNIFLTTKLNHSTLLCLLWSHSSFYNFCGVLSLFVLVQAQAVTLTVAQAFKVALDLWEVAQEGEFVE